MQLPPSLMNLKFQLGDHMVKAGFPSGDLIPAHMLPFKHLKVSLGLLCLTAFAIFIDFERLPGEDQHLFIMELKICQRPTSFPASLHVSFCA